MKKNIFLSRKQKTGAPPGSLLYTGNENKNTTLFSLSFNTNSYTPLHPVSHVSEIPLSDSENSWIQYYGLKDIEKLKHLGEKFKLHNLTLEDIANVSQRPKLENFDDYIFITIPNINIFEPDVKKFEFEQVSLVLGKNYIISFHEKENIDFAPILKRLESSESRIRKNGIHYLAYAILDLLIDHYFLMVEKVGFQIETLDQKIINDHSEKLLNDLYTLRTDILFLRKLISPVSEVVKSFQKEILEVKDNSKKQTTHFYLRDVADHIFQVNDELRVYNDMLSSMFDLYFSISSEKTNAIMKTLTAITIIFMPLTLIAGIYGMNFDFMPELTWTWGYPLIMGGMFILAIILFIFLKRKKWL